MDTPERDDKNVNGGGEPDSNIGGGPGIPGSDRPDLVRTSRLAVAACVLAAASLLLLPGLIRLSAVRGTGKPRLAREACLYVAFGLSISAAALGLISLGRIGLSAGRLAGGGFAWAGVTAPVAQGLLFLLLAVLARTRCVAFTDTCGTHLSGIGKAMLIYANDYSDELPRAGGRASQWTGRIPDWQAADCWSAYGISRPDGSGGQVSLTASFYLLVKFAEVTPRVFLCGTRRETAEKGVTEFKLRTYRHRDRTMNLTDFWDFGPDPTRHVSYAYHMPYGPYTPTTSGEPGFAVAADRNPWMDSPLARAKDFSQFKPDVPPFDGTSDQARYGNTPRHNAEGQNVLFLDSHVKFARRSYCGLDNDNIYTISRQPGAGDPWGTLPSLGSQPAGKKDSLLVNDPPASRK